MEPITALNPLLSILANLVPADAPTMKQVWIATEI
jgi:hypothetical protein